MERDEHGPPGGIERAERSHHAAPVMAGEPAGLRRYVRGVVATFGALLLATAAINLAIDPLGTFGTGVVEPVVFSDHAERLGLIEALDAPPETLILGSSRALKAEPAELERATGRRGFNAAASNGKVEDAFAYAHLAHDRWPDADVRHLWFLEAEAFRDLPPSPQLLAEPALARHFGGSSRIGSRVDDVERLFEWGTLRSSAKSVRWTLEGRRPGNLAEFGPDGFRTVDVHDRSERAGVPFATRLAESIATAERFVPALQREGLAPAARERFEQTVADMNAWGSEPVIVLGPVHPAYRDAFGGTAYDALGTELDRYLASLRPRLRFTVVDMRDLDAFGGTPDQFYDGIHLRVPNMRLLLAAVAREAGPALQ